MVRYPGGVARVLAAGNRLSGSPTMHEDKTEKLLHVAYQDLERRREPIDRLMSYLMLQGVSGGICRLLPGSPLSSST